MATVIAEAGQTLMDIAVQECGSMEAFMPMVIENNLSPTTQFNGGEEVTVTDIINPAVVNAFKVAGEKPATEI